MISTDTLRPSACTRQDTLIFVQRWNTNYDLLFNNCQNFAEALKDTLLHSPCSNKGRKRDAEATVALEEYIDAQLQNCSLVCCNDSNSGAYPMTGTGLPLLVMTATVLFIFAVTL